MTWQRMKAKLMSWPDGMNGCKVIPEKLRNNDMTYVRTYVRTQVRADKTIYVPCVNVRDDVVNVRVDKTIYVPVPATPSDSKTVVVVLIVE